MPPTRNLKAALARLQQARAQTRIARAGYFPSVVLNFHGHTGAWFGEFAPLAPKLKHKEGGEQVYNDFDLEADLPIRLDLFWPGGAQQRECGARLATGERRRTSPR